MATVNKDFKIKSGLVVEGTTGTINGQDILTKKQADQDYIVNLIGGTATPNNTPDTVVKRDENGDFAAGTVTVNRVNIGEIGNIHDDGDLIIENTNNDDIILAAEDIRLNSQDDVRLNAQGDVVLQSGGVISLRSDSFIGTDYDYPESNRIATQGYVDDAAANAEQGAVSYVNGELLNYTTTANLDTTVGGYGYLKNADLPTMYSDSDVDAHLSGGDGITYSAGTISADLGTGLNIAAGQIAVDRTTVDAWYDASGAAATAEQNAKDYADDKVADLVNGAPALLDTLNELAAALEDNPDVIADLRDIADGKQDTLTAGENISIVDDVISVTGLVAADISDFDSQAAAANSGLWDTYGSAASAGTNAENFAQGLVNNLTTTDIEEGSNLYFTNQRAIDAVGGTIGDAIDQLDTDDIEEGYSNLYFTDIRARGSAGDLLAGAQKSNIEISFVDGVLSIAAENGVAQSTTDDLAEGEDNLYFTDARVTTAITNATHIAPQAIDITWVRREEATWTDVATASKATCHSASTSEGSMKYLVRVTASVGGTRHSHVTEVLATVDGGNGVAVVEYGTIYTSAEPLATVTVEWNASTSKYDLNVTTANNNSEVMVAATLMATLD